MGVLSQFQKSVNSTLDLEGKKLFAWIRSELKPGATVLDVGCGYGRRLRALRAEGFRAVGVEVNSTIVAAVQKEGMECFSPEAFFKNPFPVDGMIFSHVIEHFAPDALLKFMGEYLTRLKPGGRVYIATPLMSASFYDDFDHVKPYQPAGLMMVFVENAAQVQFRSSHSLRLTRLWYRRSPFRLTHFAGLLVGGMRGKLLRGVNLIFQVLFLGSFGLFGRKDGWVGEFEKV